MGSVSSVKPAECAFACGNAENEELRYFQLDSDQTSNWMKHVRFADNPHQCNVAVFEVPQSVPFGQPASGALSWGMVIFVTIRPILPNEELKVAYSWDYASRYPTKTATGSIVHGPAAVGVPVTSGLPTNSTLAENHSFNLGVTANGNADVSPIIPDMEYSVMSERTDDEVVSDSENVHDFLPLDDECMVQANLEETEADDTDAEDSEIMDGITTVLSADNHECDDAVSKMRHPEECPGLPLTNENCEPSSTCRTVHPEPSSGEIVDTNHDSLKTKKHLQTRKQGKCLVCGQNYFDLVSHVNAAHTEEDIRAVDDACFICHKKFKSNQRVARHFKAVHCRISPPDEAARLAALDYIRRTGFLHYRCAACGKVFTSEALLNVHTFAHDTDKSRHENQPERKCPACTFTATTFAELTEHTGQHARKLREQNKCILCGTHVASSRKHIKSYHPEVLKMLRDKWSFECSECSQVFINIGALRCHMNKSHQGRQCLYCRFRTPCVTTFGDHVKQHAVDGSFPCQWCGKSCGEYGLLAAHVRESHRDVADRFAEEYTESLSDSHRPEDFVEKGTAQTASASGAVDSAPLAEFIEHMKETTTFSYFCRSCHLHFSIKALLDLHQIHHYADRTELNQRPERRCPACDFEAACFADLMHHTKEHGLSATDHKPCTVCGEHAQSLKWHFRTKHKDIMTLLEESWQVGCEECGERFKNKTRLDLHIQSAHLGFQCLYCAKLFRKQRDLGLHAWPEHSVNGEFPCTSCDKTFRSYPLARQHYREYHDVTQMKTCDICQHVCRGKKQLAEHMKSAHDVQTRIGKFKRGMKSQRAPFYKKTPTGGCECPECGKVLKSCTSLYLHLRHVHHCGKKVAEWNKMLISGEIPEKPRLRFSCDECGIVVSSASSLHRHRRWKHVGDYKENFEKRRAEKKRLGIYTHWKTYKKPRDRMALEDFPHKCDVCQLGFMREIALEKHNTTRHQEDIAKQS
ncbi:zinc finger protein 658B-like [Paramacrobiotus metropolitanus]|uniref:zinc finger protein 658B-like n=1 Tax=Paramacrobiotus metropolitanus TaxID=2943436 RepID=UPI002445DCE9|nr:zinc finger protein 658B-like [Paramacrobiotus metropolitanus]